MKQTIIKNEKGSITLFILIAMIFFIMVLLGVFILMQNRQRSLGEEVEKVKENYGSNVSLDDLYTQITGDTPYVTETVLDQIYQSELRDKAHPVGSILTTSNSANPGTYMPGTTWVAWGQGRSPIGMGRVEANTYTGHGNVSAGNTNFTTVEMMGGSHLATMPAHTHSFSGMTSESGSHTHTSYYYAGKNRSAIGTGRDTPGGSSADIKYSEDTSEAGSHKHTVKGTTGSTVGSNGYNYTPYITEYMWKRVS